MKKIDCIFILTAVLFLLAAAGMNIKIVKSMTETQSKEYRVPLKRAEKEIAAFESEKKRSPDSIEELQEKYGNHYDSCILGITSIKKEELTAPLIDAWSREETEEYCLFATADHLYKIRYVHHYADFSKVLPYINGTAILLLGVLLAFYLYVRQNILKPFHTFSKLPYEIAKGHLSKPLEESRHRYFGKYLWGMNMLRENLEESRERELVLQKEKKLLLLSLSHDIKTPLNAIALYAKAISRNLYQKEEKKAEIAEKIYAKVTEIEGYMAEIIQASNQDFLTFEVNNTGIYSQDVIAYIQDYYEEKMNLNQIEFSILSPEKTLIHSRGCLLFGDKDRLIEVIQNVVENAIKYGDGRKIWVMAKRSEEEYEITVRNTGCTLKEAELSHIFDSFFRGSNAAKKKGSGLGLSICRRLMHLMEGEILADICEDGRERIMEFKIVLHVA